MKLHRIFGRKGRKLFSQVSAQVCEPLESRVLLATDLWNGANADWNTPADWSLNRVPNATDSVVINSGTVTVSNSRHRRLADNRCRVEPSSQWLFADFEWKLHESVVRFRLVGARSTSGDADQCVGHTLTLSAARSTRRW